MENVLDVGQILFLKLVRIIDVVIAALDVHGTKAGVCIEGEHLTLPETCVSKSVRCTKRKIKDGRREPCRQR